MDKPEETGRWVRRRITELEARREALHSRFAKPAAAGGSHDGDAARRAHEFAVRALDFARHAYISSLRAHTEAARIHDEASRVHDRMAEIGIGEVAWHRHRAEHHRRLAADERRRADGADGD